MDINDLPTLFPSTLTSYPTDPNSSYTFSNPRSQNFAFRCPIMKYIKKNPTGKAWTKLILTCKYFFAKYPFYPVKRLSVGFDNVSKWKVDGIFFEPTNIPKFWVFDALESYRSLLTPFTVFDVISKTVKCDLRTLLIGGQALTWENYQTLVSSDSLTEISFMHCSFKYSNGKDVTIDKLVENLENFTKFTLCCSKSESNMFEKDTVKKLGDILFNFKKMRSFELFNLDETFDLSSFMDFYMKNETISVYLSYVSDLHFSDNYKEMLETCFKQIVANPPKIYSFILILGFRNDQYSEFLNLK